VAVVAAQVGCSVSVDPAPDETAVLVGRLARLGLTLAVAESLTGGELVAELTRPAGASAVVLGGVVVYATELKHTLVGVDAGLLAQFGPVHPEVAAQLARGVRSHLSVGGVDASIGLATTGVAGPGPQGGHAPGTVFVGVSIADRTRVVELGLTGTREEIRKAVVRRVIAELAGEVEALSV
jgi:nicotinamide-nucleotide amidase